ncbi:hypothetical protein [Salarchaeum sp. JOR-1]|uniref:DUF7470 family protein n=1 Tax=Salarchaeum sp. JOR-1 TaxID=2599399 RepID=UPI001198710C|nr:hypothetical protein [Salarchaeum sp. JOR-1]QDX40104.1 hypothetical protein FQU85_04060 [Salarchaeum sp. JOR-1]
MLDKLGTQGLVGILLVVVGLAVVAYNAPIVAIGLFVVLLGLALLVRRGLRAGMEMMGMA